MRHYWLKIMVGMLGVFAVGMVIVTLVRHGTHRVRSVFDTAEPISIPLAFVPFKLNGTKVGSIDHLTVLRSAPKKVSGADLAVTLADSFPASELTGCVLVAEQINKLDEHSTFSCSQPSDTADRNLVPAGSVRVRGGPTLPFFADRSELADFNDNAHERADSLAEAQSELADSLADVLGDRIDSLKEVRDSLVRDRAAVVVNVRGVNVDSIRSVTRRMVDSALHHAMQERDSLRHHPVMPTPPPAPHVPRSR